MTRARVRWMMALFSFGDDELTVAGYARQVVTTLDQRDKGGRNQERVCFGPLEGECTVTVMALFDDHGRRITQMHEFRPAFAAFPGDSLIIDPGELIIQSNAGSTLPGEFRLRGEAWMTSSMVR